MPVPAQMKVCIPEPDYLLAMKTLAARVDGTDKQDVVFLINLLGLDSPQQVFAILEPYYPRQPIRPATQFLGENFLSRV